MQVEHIRLTPGFESTWLVNLQPVESTSLSKLWFQIVNLHPYSAGAVMVQGCVNGYGERTGNADLTTIAANLELKMERQALPVGMRNRLL